MAWDDSDSSMWGGGSYSEQDADDYENAWSDDDDD